MSPVVQAVVLGVLEGLTEFLPVSSTGHLVVTERLIGYRDIGETFTVVVQLGAILAVVWFYWRTLLAQVVGLVHLRREARRFWLNIVVASLPAGILGLLLQGVIQMRLFSPLVVAVTLVLGGVVLWWVEVRQQEVHAFTAQGTAADVHAITPRQALIIGLAQAVALIPGVSRSGASIVGGLLLGLPRVTATAFSFFLGLPILGVAGLYSVYKARHVLGQVPGGSSALLAGTLAAFATALLSVGWLLRFVSQHDFKGFAVYRVAFGVLLFTLVVVGVLR